MVLLIGVGIVLYSQVKRFTARSPGWDAHLTYEGEVLTPENLPRIAEYPACTSRQLLREMIAFNKAHPSRLVRFEARPEPNKEMVELSAWWMPVENPLAPRIVVFHEVERNFNADSVQVLAFLLRSIGFAVLAVNFRDHGSSGKSYHPDVSGVGYDYPFDVLGAWDFVQNDTSATLGGAVPENQVGLLGISSGGNAVVAAMGMETRVHAAWVDGLVPDLREQLKKQMLDQLGWPAGPMLAPVAWWMSHRLSGVDLNANTPFTSLPIGGAKLQRPRAIGVAANTLDHKVPLQELQSFFDFLGSERNWYNLEETYLAEYVCGTATHCRQHAWRPNTYRRKLCHFWSSVFGRDSETCGLSKLKVLRECNHSVCLRSPDDEVLTAGYPVLPLSELPGTIQRSSSTLLTTTAVPPTEPPPATTSTTLQTQPLPTSSTTTLAGTTTTTTLPATQAFLKPLTSQTPEPKVAALPVLRQGSAGQKKAKATPIFSQTGFATHDVDDEHALAALVGKVPSESQDYPDDGLEDEDSNFEAWPKAGLPSASGVPDDANTNAEAALAEATQASAKGKLG